MDMFLTLLDIRDRLERALQDGDAKAAAADVIQMAESAVRHELRYPGASYRHIDRIMRKLPAGQFSVDKVPLPRASFDSKMAVLLYLAREGLVAFASEGMWKKTYRRGEDGDD